MIKDYLLPFFRDALNRAGLPSDGDITLEVPRFAEHGDLSTNLAMTLAKTLKTKPRNVATTFVEALRLPESDLQNVEIAGAGFINLTFTPAFYTRLLGQLLQQGEQIGHSEIGKGISANVEYVSANPTGLLHVGHGRNAAIGDTIANILQWNGYEVTREYYFNNAGNQMNKLGQSVFARYRQHLGDTDFPMPEDGYQGEYIKEIAALVAERYGDTLREQSEESYNHCRKAGEEWCFGKIRATLERLHIHHDVFFNEDSLYSDGKVKDTVEELRKRGVVYEKDGATWLKLSAMGMTDDRVIIKSSGEPTYRLPDIAYHYDKLHNRKIQFVVDIFGADHIATIPDVLAAITTLGEDKNRVRVIIHQFVTLTHNGEAVKMSKRTGRGYTLDDLIEEFGADVTRFFFVMRGVSTHLDFDIGLAAEQSEKNPVFYLQYAHARICSIFRTAHERGISPDVQNFGGINLTVLTHHAELDLIKILTRFPEVVQKASESLEPQAIAEYLREVAAGFHKFYHECRMLGEAEELMNARFALARVTQRVLQNGLQILGVQAPQEM